MQTIGTDLIHLLLLKKSKESLEEKVSYKIESQHLFMHQSCVKNNK